MARGHQNLGTAGAFGHDAQPEVGHRVRQRNAGGKLHRRGKGRKREASPIVSQAVVVHVESATTLNPKGVVILARLNAEFERARAAEADRRLWALQNIRYLPPIEEREAHVARLFATYEG